MNLRRTIFEQKHNLLRKGCLHLYSKLMRNQQLSAEQLAALNWEKRQQLVRLCATRIPFYQRRFTDVGFELGDLKSEEDFQSLPILEKDDIREFAHEMVNPAFDLSALIQSTTGGTTGMPLKTYNDPSIYLPAMSWRMLDWWGVCPSSNSGYLYRAIPKGIGRLASDIFLFPTKRAYLSASQMDRAAMSRFFKRIERIKAEYLVGYVGAIDEFKCYMEAENLRLPSLRAVWTTSAPLPEVKRSAFEKVFQCPVYTQYGSCEFYWVASECKERKCLHIGSDVRHVEVVDDDDSLLEGSFGDLLISDLLDHSFPLLRYRIGDRGRLLDKACGCGLPFPTMDYVRGRISDRILLPDGTGIPGEFWTTIFDDFTDTIQSFQVIQRSDYSLQILFEPMVATNWKESVAAVRLNVEQYTKGLISTDFEQRIVTSNDGGKFRFVVSHVGK